MSNKITIVSKKVTTPVFRVGFPNIWEPKKNQSGQEKYGLSMMFPKQGFQNPAWLNEILKEVQEQVQQQVFRGQAIPPHARLNPLKDGDVPNTMGKVHFQGYYVVNAGSNFQPGVVDNLIDPQTGKPLVITDKNQFYAGCYARATVHAFWYNSNGNMGIGISLNNVQKIKDGDRLGGGSQAEDEFGEYGDYSDPSAGAGLPQQPAYPQNNYQNPAPMNYGQQQQQYGHVPVAGQPYPQQNIMNL